MKQRRSILVLSSLFPRPRNPVSGIFNYQVLSALSPLADMELFSPVSWLDRIGERLFSRRAPGSDVRRAAAGSRPDGLDPRYPLHFSMPVVGRSLNGYFQYRAILRAAAEAHLRKRFDVMLCYWVYPDGDAAFRLSGSLGIPYVLVALGSDLNVMGHAGQTKRLIRRTLRGARRVIAVSDALRSQAVALGAPPDAVSVVRNGVNTRIFTVQARQECRDRLDIGAGERVIVFVGDMLPVKGFDVLLDALALMEGDRPTAIFVGAGTYRRAFERRAAGLGLGRTARFTGQVPHEEVAGYLNAADFLVLPSRLEGCPNVVLEALACGTPVIASAVGGIPELITRPDQGILVPPDSPPELAKAMREGFLRSWRRDEIARTSTRTWEDAARETHEIIERCLDDRPA
jgi:glycosyltransferase involved in cell wall biosynthesis